MARKTIKRTTSPFDRIRHVDEHGGEYWSARELGPLLDYSGWQRFSGVITKAKTACKNSGQAISDHFNADVNMVPLGSGAQRRVPNWRLSRYACYLIAQNADPSKEIVAQGQMYFAVQTRRAELADEAGLAASHEEENRLWARDKMTYHNKLLAAAAQKAGVKTNADYGQFQNAGYRGLYDGMGKADIAIHKGLSPEDSILDHMGSTELIMNVFRASQTEEVLRNQPIYGKERATRTHHVVGAEIRATIKRIGGTMPEKLPTPAESIPQLRRKRRQVNRPPARPALVAPKQRAKRSR